MTPRRSFVALASFACLAFAACGDGGTPPEGTPLETSPDDSAGGGSSSSGGGTITFGDGGSAPGVACGIGAGDIQLFGYTIESKSLEVWRFAPTTLTFTRTAEVRCPGFDGVPRIGAGTGAVDRRGRAYVNLSFGMAGQADAPNGEGGLYRVDTTTGACELVAPKLPAATTFGSSFTADAPGASTETWFVAQPTFARIDPSTYAPTSIGTSGWVPSGYVAQLLGGGDGSLRALAWAGGTGDAVQLHTVDKLTGRSTDQRRLEGMLVRAGTAWAYTSWGGEVWGFLAQGSTFGNEGASQVARWDASGKANVVAQHPTLRVAVAGTSTCAPSSPVR